MKDLLNFKAPDHQFRDWFRGLHRDDQWLFGVPILLVAIPLLVLQAACLFSAYNEEQPGQAIWFTLILFVVTIVLNELLRPKPNLEDARPAGLGDFQAPTATEGRPVPVIFGRMRQKGPNVIWYGDLVQLAIEQKVKTGLWSSERFISGFQYNLGMQMALCRGPDVALRRVWIGETEVFSGNVTTDTFFDIDEPDLFGGPDLGSGGLQATCDFYTGSSAQAVNAYLDDADRQRITTAATQTAPRYTGTSYVLARQLTSAAPSASDQGAYVGDSTTIKAWSFEVERFPALFSSQSGSQNKIGSDGDCNPINAIYEMLTNAEWGFGFPSTDVDIASFKAAADVMITEGNGFSFLMDRQISAKQFLQEIQRQIDGVVYVSQRTGQWTIKLARADYDIDLVPQLDDDNVAEVRDYTRGAWEDTTNTIQVQYFKRDDDYKESYALAQDTANALMRGDGTIASAVNVTAKVVFPGVKDSALASNLAWRELRGQTYPLARCVLVTNREMWDLSIGDVVAWTNARLGFTKLPMRITSIDYGTMTSNKMSITVVQDVFKFAAASMGTPPSTQWVPPTITLTDYPADEQLGMESPRAITVRDPLFSGDETVAKAFVAARRQAGEVAFKIVARSAPSNPGGSYADAGDVVQFSRIGELSAALDAGTDIPTTSITVVPTPDNQTNIEAAFDDAATLQDLGVDLAQLVYVGGDDAGEFMLVNAASLNASNVDLDNVYRGALDTPQKSHASGTAVWLVHLGAGLTSTNFDSTHDVDLRLLARSSTDQYVPGSITDIELDFDRRAIRPYPPASLIYNGSGNFGAPALEGDGSGLNGVGFDVDWIRRRYDASDEVAAMLADTDPDDAPGASSTQYRVTVSVDPSGANTTVLQTAFIDGPNIGTFPTQAQVVNEAAAGTEIRVLVETQHTYDGTTRAGRDDLVHDVVPTSARSSQFYLGGDLSSGVGSNSYTVTTAGVHNVNIGAGYSTANVQHRINGGSWTNIIAAGAGTTGATASLSISDTIEVRVDANESPARNFVEIDDGTSDVAYGVFTDNT